MQHVIFGGGSSGKFPTRWTRAVVVANRAAGRLGRILELNLRLDFRPGQVVGLSLSRHPEIEPRLYSIASAPGTAPLEILYTVADEGRLTPLLARLRPGDEVVVEGPSGTFASEPGPELWLAAGTGVAPFVSMLRAGLPRSKRLAQSARDPSDLYYRDTIATAASSGLFAYTPCVTGPTAGSQTEALPGDEPAPAGRGVYAGGIPKWISENPPPIDRRCLVSGSPGFIQAARAALIKVGVDYRKIVTEVYF